MILGDRFCFIHVPKTGGTSIQTALRPFGQFDPYYKHSFAHVVRDKVGAACWQRRFTFAFSRDPLERLVSLFEHDRRNPRFGNFLRWGMAMPHFNYGVEVFSGKMEDWINCRLRWWQLCQAGNFDGFVRGVAAHAIPVVPQFEFVMDSDGRVIVDMIGRFEQLEHDFATVCKRIGARIELPHRNGGDYGDWRVYYTPELARLVYLRFKEDFELFGYPEPKL